MEDPHIRREYEALLAGHGIPTRMDPAWYVKPEGVVGAIRILGDWRRRSGDYAGAESYMKQVVALKPDSRMGWNALASLYQERAAAGEAVAADDLVGALLSAGRADEANAAAAAAAAEGRGLLVLDAYRPWSVTRMFWDAYPMHRAYLADPQEGSRHNRGCAVDLTVVDLATGKEVRMPSGYDDFSERAHPGWQGGSAAERAERDRLRGWMEAEGFTVHPNEWWHFDHAGWEQYPVMDVPLEETRPAAVSGPARGGPAASR